MKSNHIQFSAFEIFQFPKLFKLPIVLFDFRPQTIYLQNVSGRFGSIDRYIYSIIVTLLVPYDAAIKGNIIISYANKLTMTFFPKLIYINYITRFGICLPKLEFFNLSLYIAKSLLSILGHTSYSVK